MIRASLVVLVMAALAATPASASSLSEKRDELHRVLLQLTQRREHLQQVRDQERRVLGDLEGIDRSRDAAARRLTSLAVELQQSQTRVETLGLQLAATQRDLAMRREHLSRRLRDIYRYGQGGYVEVMLGTTNFAEFVTRWYFVSTVMRSDSTLIASVTADATRYQYLQESLQADRVRLGEVMAQTAASKREMTLQDIAKRTVLRRIQGERVAYERAVRELEANSRDLEVLIRRFQNGRASARVVSARGIATLLWPAQGSITSGFGLRRHPVFGVQHMHTGVDIGATWGSPVLAAADGQVIYTGWYGGYGKLVIVDHGGGVSTLYAHLFEILVSSGTSVRRGQVLGRVGSTGFSTGPHLHFEVRIDGQPIDPIAR